jgi:alanyl-tRNA synthetase
VSSNENKAFVVIASSEKAIPANELVKDITVPGGGSGGGRWDFAQGGTPSLDKLMHEVNRLPELVAKRSRS